MKRRVAFTIDPEVIDEIDSIRGLAGRSEFINHILKIGLKNYKAAERRTKRTCAESDETKNGGAR